MTHAETETLERDPRLWWLLLARGRDLDLRVRARTGTGNWRFTCPVDSAHEVTLVNGVLPLPHRPQGLALTCHGPAGHDSPGHSLSTHQRARAGQAIDMHPDLGEIPYPCRFCGCTESMVLAALGARPRDKYRQDERQRDGRCSRCGASGYRVGGRGGVLCLVHLADREALRAVVFGS